MKRAIILSSITLVLAGCGGDSDTPATAGAACSMTGVGTLAVNITGLPSGVAARVEIGSPGGPAAGVTASTTITGPAGSYTVTVSTATDDDPIVRKAFTGAAPATVSVCGGKTSALDIDYTLIPTSNQIWWANQNNTNDTLSYASSALAASGTTDPTVEALTDGTLPGAFTPNGDVWLIDRIATGLKMYTASALAAGGSPTPSVVVTSSALTASLPGPISFAFDKDGNAWVGVTANQILEFTAAQLASSGDVTPAVVISNVPSPGALAFDANGNLWAGSDNLVVEYVQSRLGASDSNPPDVSISSESPPPSIGPLPIVHGLAFNATGDLWVNYDGIIAQIPKAQLVSATITPDIQITADVLALPEGIALDDGGGLWMSYSAGKICKFGASQLVAANTGMAVAPEVVITSSSIGSAGTAALFPAPAGLPLYSSLP